MPKFTWNAFKSLQYGSVRRQPITTAFKYGYRWQMSANDAFTVPRIVSTLIRYIFSQSRINVSISSNGFSGWIYKHSRLSSGCRFENKLTNMCNSTVQSLPPLNDKKIPLGSYVSSVLFKTCVKTKIALNQRCLEFDRPFKINVLSSFTSYL